jgi:DNA-binding transcriptional LysR family regulator
LGKSVRYVVATPGYLKGRQLPKGPNELTSFECVMLNARNNETEWNLVSGRRKARVPVSGPICSRDFNSVSAFVHRGHGVGLLPSIYCDQTLARGQLVRLLPEWASPPIPVFAVYPGRKFIPQRLQVFLQALGEWKGALWIRD